MSAPSLRGACLDCGYLYLDEHELLAGASAADGPCDACLGDRHCVLCGLQQAAFACSHPFHLPDTEETL